MLDPLLADAARNVPAGAWAIGVSGGADSVALLRLLHVTRSSDLRLHIAHFDHELRGAASDADARFVEELARQLGMPCTIARRSEIEPTIPGLPANPSARYRKLRLRFFEQVVRARALQGVLLAHHADDQAETVLQRLLRGSAAAALGGMSPQTRLGDLLIVRPLLPVRREQLRAFLASIDQPWRTDESNESPAYLRNQLRRVLKDRAELFDALLSLAQSCAALRDWSRETAPVLPEHFPVAALAGLPQILARESARRWLAQRGVPRDEIDGNVLDRLIRMATDAATPAAQHFPGQLRVRRRRGELFVG